MEKMMIGNKTIYIYGSLESIIWVLQPVNETHMNLLEDEYKLIDSDACLIGIGIKAWNMELSPWEAEAVFGDDDFGDGARELLGYIKKELIPALCSISQKERSYAIAGYSLAGLFALWAGCESDMFEGVVAASPSVWFHNWKDYIDTHMMQAGSVYLSLGDKESKTRNKVMAQVGNAIEYQYDKLLGQDVDTVFEWNQGNHFADVETRVAKGICMVVKNLRR